MRRALLLSARGTGLLAVPLVLVALLAQTFAEPATLRVVVNFFVALVLVLGIQVFSGNTGIVSFGHVAFMGLGAYTAALLTIPPAIKELQLPGLPGPLADASLGFLPAMLASLILVMLVAAVVALPLARMREDAMAMATIGVLVIFFVVFDNWTQVTRGATGIFGIPRRTDLWVALIFALLAFAVARLYRESAAGLKLRASREDAVAAEALGADVVRLRHGAWIVSAAIVGVGGALWAQYNIAFGPRQFFFDQTFELLAMLVIGGIATTWGAVVGAGAITLVTELLRRVEDSASLSPGVTPIVLSLLILLLLRLRPDGLLGLQEVDRRLRSVRAKS